MLEKFAKFNRRVSGWVEWIGLFALLLIMALTCVDVIGAKLFRAPVFGALDVVMLAQLVAISFAASMALLLGRMVQVEFFVPLLPKRLQIIVDCLVHFLGFVLFVLIVWRLFAYAYDLQIGNEESMTARIPLAPFAYGAAAACIPVCLVFLQWFIASLIKVFKK
ncbi:MAG: TRAP transporter small permease subunit [Desulfobacteraceae bacterium]